MNWSSLTFEPLTRDEIRRYTPDPDWQDFRASLLNEGIVNRFRYLEQWLVLHGYDRASQVQVTNYVNALKRGGLIK